MPRSSTSASANDLSAVDLSADDLGTDDLGPDDLGPDHLGNVQLGILVHGIENALDVAVAEGAAGIAGELRQLLLMISARISRVYQQ